MPPWGSSAVQERIEVFESVRAACKKEIEVFDSAMKRARRKSKLRKCPLAAGGENRSFENVRLLRVGKIEASKMSACCGFSNLGEVEHVEDDILRAAVLAVVDAVHHLYDGLALMHHLCLTIQADDAQLALHQYPIVHHGIVVPCLFILFLVFSHVQVFGEGLGHAVTVLLKSGRE